MNTLTVPELSLVLLVGASGSGKSTFAATHFSPWEVLSSDHYRGVVSNDPLSQAATADAFAALEYLASVRLRRGLLTVIDATNVRQEDRKRWVALARRFHVVPVAIVLDVPTEVAVARNEARPDRPFGARVVRNHTKLLRRSLKHLKREGFRYIHRLQGEEAIAQVTIDRPRPWTDRRDETGPFDLIGDIHGCFDELCALLDKLGYTLTHGDTYAIAHPDGRRPVFLGDLVDRGPQSPEVLRLVMDLVQAKSALCVPGNHEVKLLRWLQGKRVRIAHGLQETIDQLASYTDDFRTRVMGFLDGLVSHFVLDGGKLVVAHAGMKEELAGRASGRVRQFALYGETTGETDEFGLPVRYAWAEDYRGDAAVVYGHTPVPFTEWVNNTMCVDTGCVFGGELTAMRWPERELVSVPAAETYAEPIRPLQPVAAAGERSSALHASDVFGRQRVETRYRMSVRLDAERTATAMEVVSRFAVDPRWLIHLPPTMAPSDTSKRADLLEHPDEAFAYYRACGVETVVCEEKHMGSRALVIVGRSDEAIAARFGVPAAPGIVLSRRGRRFFGDPALEAALLSKVRAAFEAASLWDELDTDWALLDAELMPWSAKAQALLEQQYAPVGAAARQALGATAKVLEAAAARQDVADLLERTQARHDAATAYTDAYRRYCWPVASVDDLRLAPFHLLATEGKVHTDQTHAWHMTTLARLAEHEPVLMATPWRTVRLDDEASVAEAVAWWTAHTEAGGEGMVVKPETYLTWNKGRLVQPAIKCRGREYLRIIYGAEYTLPHQLDRLRQRGTHRKRTLAMRELVLGLEALERFVAREPLRRIHTPVMGILALESEPVDPRL